MGRWLEAVELGARGSYGPARRLLESVPVGDPHYSLAQSTLGSHARQVGASGQVWDARALAAAGDAESLVDALVGLAADAVVGGDVLGARKGLAKAASTLEGAGSAADLWRSTTRWHWVSAETALLVGDRDTAYAEARAARRSCAGRSVRHEAKSTIIAMVAGDEFARSQAGPVLEMLVRHEWASLQWPLALVLADLRDDTVIAPDLLARSWHVAWAAVGHIAKDIPRDLRDAWQEHPGVQRICSGPVA